MAVLVGWPGAMLGGAVAATSVAAPSVDAPSVTAPSVTAPSVTAPSVPAAGTGVQVRQVTVAGVPEPDGTPVRLDASFYLPPGSATAPAVLLAHGFGGSKAELDPLAQVLAASGYAVLTYSARGFGASGGSIHLDSLDYEVRDASLLLDWLAQQPRVQLDSPGDPRVGVAGASYGGGLALLLAGTDPRVDAVVPAITWNDLSQALFPQFRTASRSSALPALAGFTPASGHQVVKSGWAVALLGGGGVDSSAAGPSGASAGTAAGTSGAPPGPALGGARGAALAARLTSGGCGRFAADLCQEIAHLAATGEPSSHLLQLLKQSSPATVLSRVRAPTLLVQGEADSLFPLSEADANAAGIAATGTTVHEFWYTGGHDALGTGLDQVQAATLDWFGRYLGGGGSRRPAATPAFQVAVPGSAGVQVRSLDAIPGIAGAPLTSRSLPLTGSAQPVSAGQDARFGTAPLGQDLAWTGAPQVTLTLTPRSAELALYAQVADVDPTGQASIPNGLVAPFSLTGLTPGRAQTVTVRLPAVVRQVPAGHRLQLVVSVAATGYEASASPTPATVALATAGAGPALLVPTSSSAAVSGGPVNGPLWWSVALGVLGVLGGVGVAVAARRRSAPFEPALAEVPLAIEGLAKSYRNGYRAVEDLSFRVERGWVLGLLGPNGAGKTTALRVLMGLIRPSEGAVRVFGHQVVPGAPVLSRVGSFVEGPGFLPHVSGRDNLRLWWRATGRPAEQARLDVVLDIAGLGEDAERAVRTYSQGMRQRLAIAQAMLGMPELLVLDEPTNGLDPPQIREMREVLRSYAATGRTVVVSSHMLAEVEQTCTHVVVMHLGRLVAQGRVAELVATGGSVSLDVSDPVLAERVAAGVPGVDQVRTEDGVLLARADAEARAALVAALVRADVAVSRVAPQHGLEDAFLELVGRQ